MGVPKFFRYTSERYPCLNELVKQYQIPDFDNMYLDMNGIIHNCSHPDDSNPHFRITEEKIFQDVFHYISILFQIIKPKKLFFMAIDGVAPRAKMNQQRGRRFRSAREAEKLEEDARAKGETLPSEKRFDSNCITPGTVFMARLHEQLKYFIKQKMSTDPLWSKVKVILSGHETPGEGEHKIMDYIRWARSQPEYDPNTRHCLYGLDADLIMLGMCTHEPHFALLREEVKFGKTTQRATSPEETNFYLLHLSLLKEYLEQEFILLKESLPFPFDIEKIVDDWVLMGFLVGNDFIPNLPNMHIGNDALPLLYKTYMTVLPTLKGYINEAGELNLERFEIFMQELAKIDKEKFQDTYADLKYFEAKTGRRPNMLERKEYKPNNDDTFNVNIEDIKAKPDDELQALIDATDEMLLDDIEGFCEEDYEETSDEEANIELEFRLHKRDYYMNKLDYSSVTEEVLADQAEGYVRAIQWNLYYYYKGCPSWCWYYPHHYAPYMSDIKGFKDLKIEFELGDPFKPFEQLLAVLPAASKQLLPAPFHDLMTDEDSPIVHYYPINFETDLNGKKNDWEAVVLIPFIDEVNLLSAMAPCYQRLTEEELKRNTHGPMLVYNWSPENQGIATAPAYFPPIQESHAMERIVWRNELDVPSEKLRRGILPNANRHLLFPGFPTLRHIKYKTEVKKVKVKVFDQPSRNENMIVQIIRDDNEETALEKVAQELLGKVIWVGWPHLTKAKVISVSNEKMRLHHIDKQNNNINGVPTYTTEMNAGNLHRQWLSERSTIIEHNMNRLGIELGPVKIIIHAVNHKGYKFIVQDNCKMIQEPEYCTVPCGYAYQAVVTDVSAYIASEPSRYSTPQEAYPPGDNVFLLTHGQYYGAQATVIDSDIGIRSGRIKLSVICRDHPVPIVNTLGTQYYTTHNAAATCGISSQLLSRITGSVFVIPGERHNNPTEQLSKVNLGLNLKFNKKNQEVSGYTRRCKDSNQWMYSRRCIDLIRNYAAQYPEIFDRLAYSLNNDVFFESDIWPEEMGQNKQKDVATWLKTLPHNQAMRRECGSEAMEPEDMKLLAEHMDKQQAELKAQEKMVTLQVKWHLLYKPELHEGNIQPDPRADFRLYDRVVCVARHSSVPRGAAGTVTAIYPAANTNTVRLADKLNAMASYQVMFDEPFPGAMSEELFEPPRHYRMQPTYMLNISFGRQLRDIVTNMKNNMDPTWNYAPNVLRREDGHNSAFANYSPPVDKKVSPAPVEKRTTPNASQQPITQRISNNGPDHDNGTHLLKSLLKISENDGDTSKGNKNSTDNQNWRVRSDLQKPAQPQPKPTRMQHQNWRKETTQNNVKPLPANEWTNSNYKQPQAPLPPFPSFGPSVPTTIPFPSFNAVPPPPSLAAPATAPAPAPPPHAQLGFPKHLPTVTGNNVTLGPSWMAGQPSIKPAPPNNVTKPANASGSNDKVINPFVPLQVQTSRRRIQNTGGISSKRSDNDIVVPKCVVPNPQPANVPTPQQPQSTSSKPIKKKKPRIAANLPFQMD